MIDFLSIVLLIFGVLQIILFFKIWGMTNEVSKIKEKLEKDPSEEDSIILNAQLKTLNGEKDAAYELYQKAFYLSVIELYNKTIQVYNSEDDMNYKTRDGYWEDEYKRIAEYYNKRINKIGEFTLPTERFDSYLKIHSFISKI